MEGPTLNLWMVIGFLIAAYAVVANDSLQTLGTYITSNHGTTPKWIQMAFISAITTAVLLVGWLAHAGDPSWGRLELFPMPDPFTWVYVIPPLVVLALTAWGAPVSTSFLVLSSFVPSQSTRLIQSSLCGYGLALVIALTCWGLGLWLLERWVLRSTRNGAPINGIWIGLQWGSTTFLWSLWMVQDMGNIFVYLPRTLNGPVMASATLILCLGLCILIALGGGPIQTVLRSKTNTADLRSATVIDCVFGLCLLAQALLSSFPLSTTWVFLGLLAGRELALLSRKPEWDELDNARGGNVVLQSMGSDLGKATVAMVVSLVVAMALQPLIAWTVH